MNSYPSVYSGGVSVEDRGDLFSDEHHHLWGTSINPRFIQPDSSFPPDFNMTLSTFPMDDSCAHLFSPVFTDHGPIMASPSPLNLSIAAPSLESDHCSFGVSAVAGNETTAFRPFHPCLSKPLDPTLARCYLSYVPRPRSAFKIYSTLFDALAPYQRTTNHRMGKKNKGRALGPGSTSRQATACWRALSQMDREIFKDLARTEKELDRIKHLRNNHQHTPNFHRPTKPRKSFEEFSWSFPDSRSTVFSGV